MYTILKNLVYLFIFFNKKKNDKTNDHYYNFKNHIILILKILENHKTKIKNKQVS